MHPRRTAAPAAEAIALADLWIMTHLRETSDAGGPNDQYIEQILIPAARTACEELTERTLVSTPWLLTLPAFPCASTHNPLAAITLRMPPIISVQSVQYLDADGALQTLATSDWQLDTASEPGRLLPAPGTSWPATQAGAWNAVQIAYTAGYGDSGANVPAPLRFWMAAAIASMYASREADGTTPRLAHDFCAGLLAPYRVMGV